MLVEIILASVIAMGIAYFITDLTIKLKNKNDDLLVKTLVSTDQAIIYNTIMKDLYNVNSSFSCDNIKISVDDNKFQYNSFYNKRMAHANHPFIVYFFLDLLLVASKLTFRRNSTISSGASGRRTETQ